MVPRIVHMMVPIKLFARDSSTCCTTLLCCSVCLLQSWIWTEHGLFDYDVDGSTSQDVDRTVESLTRRFHQEAVHRGEQPGALKSASAGDSRHSLDTGVWAEMETSHDGRTLDTWMKAEEEGF